MKKVDEKQQSDLSNVIRDLAKDIQAIYAQAENYYPSAVDDLILRKSKNTKEIELLLDYMLDFADSEEILTSYRKLCRYYFDINPKATADYIRFYKEIFDADEKKFKSG